MSVHNTYTPLPIDRLNRPIVITYRTDAPIATVCLLNRGEREGNIVSASMNNMTNSVLLYFDYNRIN